MNILQVFQKFITQKDCIEHLEKTRWGDEPVCPYCGSGRTGRLQKRHHCHACKTSFSVTVGTIFHGTHLPLQKWFLAISLMLNARKGISGLQLSRDLNVNKNTAWRISMQIRRAMKEIGEAKALEGSRGDGGNVDRRQAPKRRRPETKEAGKRDGQDACRGCDGAGWQSDGQSRIEEKR